MPTWRKAKHLLAEYDGAATELFVVGLPLSQLPVVVAALAELPALEVTSFADEALDPSEPFDVDWRSRFEAIQSRSCQHSLRSANGTPRHLQVYLWLRPEASQIEVELVFWNDMTFPQSLATEECDLRLEAFVSLAEACRVGIPSAQCVLASEHNGPIEELLERDEFVVVW